MNEPKIMFSTLREALESHVFSLPENATYDFGHRAEGDERIPVSPLYVHTPHTHRHLTEAVPGCLAGIALHAIGVPLDVLADYEGDGVGEVIYSLEDDHGVAVDMDMHAQAYICHVQSMQDAGDHWSSVLAQADALHLRSIENRVNDFSELNNA